MHEAARACLLIDLKRFLQQAYVNKKDKTDFPVEIGIPLQPENILTSEDRGPEPEQGYLNGPRAHALVPSRLTSYRYLRMST